MAVAPMRKQGDTTYEPLPMDTYYMRVREADITLSSFKDKDGNDQHQLMLCWEISRLTAEQQEAEVDEDRWVRQWLSLYYGETKNGPSKLKAFIDGLRGQGLLDEFDPESGEIDSDWFIGIEQKVALGTKGNFNNVVAVGPLKAAKKAGNGAKLVQEPAIASSAQQRRNAPHHIDQEPVRRAPVAAGGDEGLWPKEVEDDDIPF